MNWSKRDFVAAMEAGKARAQTARNRGHSTGKAAKGWVKPTPQQDDTRSPNDMVRALGILAVELAIEDHWREIYPERYIPF